MRTKRASERAPHCSSTHMINNAVGNSNFRGTAGGSQGCHPRREIQT